METVAKTCQNKSNLQTQTDQPGKRCLAGLLFCDEPCRSNTERSFDVSASDAATYLHTQAHPFPGEKNKPRTIYCSSGANLDPPGETLSNHPIRTKIGQESKQRRTLLERLAKGPNLVASQVAGQPPNTCRGEPRKSVSKDASGQARYHLVMALEINSPQTLHMRMDRMVLLLKH